MYRHLLWVTLSGFKSLSYTPVTGRGIRVLEENKQQQAIEKRIAFYNRTAWLIIILGVCLLSTLVIGTKYLTALIFV